MLLRVQEVMKVGSSDEGDEGPETGGTTLSGIRFEFCVVPWVGLHDPCDSVTGRSNQQGRSWRQEGMRGGCEPQQRTSTVQFPPVSNLLPSKRATYSTTRLTPSKFISPLLALCLLQAFVGDNYECEDVTFVWRCLACLWTWLLFYAPKTVGNQTMVTKCYSGKQKALKSENSGVFILYKTGLTLRRHLPSAPSQSEVG